MTQTADWRLSDYVVESPPFFDEDRDTHRRVLFSSRSTKTIYVGEQLWRILESGDFAQLPPESLDSLARDEFIVPNGTDELAEILAENRAAIQDDRRLYQVIQPTSWCPLGCGYCGQVHSPGQMSEEDQDRLIARVDQKLDDGDYDILEVGWFGSEPLAGLPTIRMLAPRLLHLAKKHDVGYTSKVVTNGVSLKSEIAGELVHELGVEHFEITLDGTAEFHDKRRHTKKGGPTFDAIFQNLLAAAKHTDARISVRCNVDRRNKEGVDPLIDLLAEHGLQRRVSFYVAPVHSWGNDAHKKSLTTQEFAKWEVHWLARLLERGFTSALTPQRRPITCMAVSKAGELVDAQGQLFNCTEVSYVPTYGNPNTYALGTLAKGSDDQKRGKLGDFLDRVEAGEYDCNTCPMLPVCGGACPKLWDEGLLPCPSAKFNIGERLLLEAARSRLPGEALVAMQ